MSFLYVIKRHKEKFVFLILLFALCIGLLIYFLFFRDNKTPTIRKDETRSPESSGHNPKSPPDSVSEGDAAGRWTMGAVWGECVCAVDAGLEADG